MTTADCAVIAGIIATLMGIPTTLLVANLRGLTRRLERLEERVLVLDESKTDKHRWAGETIETRRKLDRVSEAIAKLSGEVNSNMGISAGLSRLADAVAKTVEK